MNIRSVTLILVLTFSKPVFSCSCQDESLEERVARANIIYSGQVIRAALIPGKGSKHLVKYEINVDRFYKGGEQNNKQKLVEVLGHSCANSLYVGKKYVVFTDEKKEAWLCSGTDYFQKYEYEIDGASLKALEKITAPSKSSN